MLAFADMLIGPAKEAGMKVPDDVHNYDRSEYPHFLVYCEIQIGRPMPHTDSHWTNAKIIAAIPDDKIKTVNYEDVMELGIEIGRPIP